MSPSRLAITLTASILWASTTTAEDIDISPFARDPSVERWIWYEVLGPQNHPYSIVYLSTQTFKTRLGEHLVVLPSHGYDIISAYTQARIDQPDCPGTEPAGDVWYTVKISEHEKNRTQRCVLPQALACDYLSAVLRLSGINWTESERRPIADFAAQIKCNSGSTGDGR
jgi:hypothetical protein